MIKKLSYRDSFKRVFLKAFVKEISGLARDKHVGRDLDFVLNDFDEFLLLCDLKGIFTNKHFVHHYAFDRVTST